MMKRTITSFIAATAVSMTLPLFAQSAASTTAGQASTTTADSKDKDEMVLTGCVEKNKSGGYWLKTRDGATAGAAERTAPTGTSGSATTTAGAASTTGDKTSGDKTASGAPGNRFWNLENAKDIDKYMNQTVEVTGRAKDSTSGDKIKGTTGSEIDARDFHVKSVRPVAASCS
jgi:hypothetical protein